MRVLSLNPWTTRDALGCIFKEIPKIGVMRLGQVQPPEVSCSFTIWGLLSAFLAVGTCPLVVVRRLLTVGASLVVEHGLSVCGTWA